MSANQKVYIVVPSYNGEDYLRQCLDSLKDQTLEHAVIVVENASTDCSAKIVKQDYPDAILLQNETNLGFAGGVNVGITYALEAGADYIALFNNDAEADPDWLKFMVERMESDEKIGIVAPKFLTYEGQHFDSTGDLYSHWGTPFPRGRGERDEGQYEKAEQVFAATGGASLYRASMFEEVGLFDERFFAYFEDVDISFRARLYGWVVWYEPKSVAMHHIGGTGSKMKNDFSNYHQLKNFYYLYFKNMPRKLFWKYILNLLAAGAYKEVNFIRRGKFKMVAKAWWTIVKNLPGVRRDRKAIQGSRVVSSDQIDKLLYHDLSPTQRQKKLFKNL